MHNRHAWKERTPEGAKRQVRAHKFAGKWSIRSRVDGDEGWSEQSPPGLGDLETLRDILMRKYQRRRASYDDVRSVEQLIAQAKG